jgi:acetyltransferase
MINNQLINPQSIVVVGGSDNPHSPGGKILENLLKHNYTGQLFVVNPKKTNIHNLPTYNDVSMLPQEVDLAIIAVAAKYIEDIIKILTEEKNTKAFIVISAGFSDAGEEGRLLEQRIVKQIKKHNGVLLGPNNIGLINTHYAGVFTTPVPQLDKQGIDLISGSGATAVFIMEAAIKQGLRFNSVWTVGNSAQIGVEEVLEYMDLHFQSDSPKTKLLYIENIDNPKKLLRHSRSLIKKGCKIVAIKAGSSEAGTRAASSHTGALSSPDDAIEALFEKAGIIRAYGRNEMIQLAGVLHYGLPDGKNMLIVTHAGGPGVMLTDILEKNGMKVPELPTNKTKKLLTDLYPGSSVTNPIDFLATGTADQLDKILHFGTNLKEIDGIAVIFGSPGLFPVYDVYKILDKHIKKSSKPIYPILPSLINVASEINEFHSQSNVSFPFEVLFGQALTKAMQNSPGFDAKENIKPQKNLTPKNTYINPIKVNHYLKEFDLPIIEEIVSENLDEILLFAKKHFPVVMKVVGPLHKTEVNGVILNIKSIEEVKKAYQKLISIPGAEAVLIQKQFSGIELYVGAKKEDKFDHLIYFGMGGVFIEVLQDIEKVLIPTNEQEILYRLKKLKAYPILKGYRGQKGIDLDQYKDLILKLDQLLQAHPEILELDFNPVLANQNELKIVDARIKI